VVRGPADAMVEAWSVTRLPFEPKGSMLEFRTSLRLALRTLADQAGPSYRLTGIYTSQQLGLVDTENVLLYNVGSSPFGRPSTIHIERRFSRPPLTPLAAGQAEHHHRYLATEDTPECGWSKGPIACRWQAPLMAGAPALSNVAAIWLSVSRVLTVLTELAPDQLFAADVTIWGPGATRRSLPGAIKSVLDGVVAACHRHDGTDASELAYRVADRAGADPTEVLGLLTRHGPAALSGRRLLHRLGEGVQWNPADERCVVADVGLAESREWWITGSLWPALSH